MMNGVSFLCCLLLCGCQFLYPAAQETQRRHLVATLPYTGNGQLTTNTAGGAGTTPNNNLGFSHAAAALLALDQFQDRSKSVVPELPMLAMGCSVDWNISAVDSESSGAGTVNALYDLVTSNNPFQAVVGGYQYGEIPALDLTTTANGMAIPSVAYGGSNLRVVQFSQFPFSTRTYPDTLALGQPLIDYLSMTLNRTNYYGLISPAFSEVAAQLQQQVQTQATEMTHMDMNMEMSLETYAVQYRVTPTLPGNSAVEALQEMKITGYRTLLLFLDNWEVELPIMAQAAAATGMDTAGYLWVLVGNLQIPYLTSDMISEPVKAFLTGSLLIQPVEPFNWIMMNEKDPFLNVWKNQGPDFVSRVNAMTPDGIAFHADADYFQQYAPQSGAAFLFDAVMSIFLGACQVEPGLWSSPLFGNRLHVGEIHKLDFTGASGQVRFEDTVGYTGSRANATVSLGMYNLLVPGTNNVTVLVAVRPGEKSSKMNSMNGMTSSTHDKMGSMTDDMSQMGMWEVQNTVVFKGGFTTGPVLRTPNNDYLGRNARIVGFTLFALVNTFFIACGLWVYRYREKKIVRAAQPVFLYLLLVGSFLISLCIVTNSFDESYGLTVEQLGILCTATPWLLICGIQVIYSSLWMKLWRINKVLQFRRRAVTAASVVWPAAVVFFIVLLILMFWTIYEPFIWYRYIYDPLTGATKAKCCALKTRYWFTPIFILMNIPVLLTMIMSWKTRDVSSDYSETTAVFYLVIFQVLIMLVTIPTFRLVEHDTSSKRYKP